MKALQGTATLLRVALRRDRVSTSLWIALLTAMVAGTAARYAQAFPTDALRRAFAASIADNRALVAFGGEISTPTLGGLVAFKIGSTMYSLVSLMAVLIVVRHTRAEEEAGRYELVAAGAVGRYASLTAALFVACGASAVAGMLAGAVLIARGLPAPGAMAFAAAIAAPGVFFAAVAAVTAQLFPTARGATAGASLVLGESYLVRFIADGSGHTWLRWLSPEGWSHQVRPFANNRVGAVGMTLVAALMVGAWAYVLAGRRDVGSGMFALRAGPASGPWLRGVFALAWRIQRRMLFGWMVGFAIAGAMLGTLAGSVPALTRNKGAVIEEFFRRYGDPNAMNLVDAFLWIVLLSLGYALALYPALVLLRLRVEETQGNAEILLATGVGRTRWVASHAVISLAGSLAVMAVAGLTMGICAGLGTAGIGAQLPRVMLAALVQVPAVWTLAGVTMVAFGLAPRRAAGIAWAAFILLNVFGEVLGPALGIDFDVADRAVPFHYLPRVLTSAPFHATPLLVLTGLSFAGLLAGTAAFRRRDVG